MSRIGYVLKVYPRFSETFVVTEILARQDQGEDLTIYALRGTSDSRFHPEICRVQAPVRWPSRPRGVTEMWAYLASSMPEADFRERFAQLIPLLADLPFDEVVQGVSLAQMVRRDGITHLHAHFASLAGRMAWLASRLTGVPYTVTTHAKDIYHESVDPVWLRRVCADADRVIAISRFNEEHLGRVLAGTGARVSLRYNALELDRFPFRTPLPPTTPLKVAAVGRMVPKKGFHDLLTAISLLREQGVAVETVLAGEGELLETLRQEVAQSGLQDSVTLPGALPQQEVRSLLRDSHVLVVPSVPTQDGNIDGLPTVVLEAMACGTPVVATDVTGMREAVRDGDTGVLLEPGQPQALAASLRDLALGRLDVTGMALRARALIETEFDSRVQAAQLASWEGSQLGGAR
ncbi:glycosyltransferase [Actinomyces weissii]|uniref:Glycosyltransferase n=1 Tax=Actinomyces weissii TaxID=675090 RepID=A0A7T7M960_9ACTO|nr:glycosyltransferase [Actinomyces weissii]QQM66722.1 glycosyltransferase [Actinomyces weissii]